MASLYNIVNCFYPLNPETLVFPPPPAKNTSFKQLLS